MAGEVIHSASADTYIAAVADLDEDEVIFSIPRSSVLNLHTGLPAVESKSSQQAIVAMPEWLVPLSFSFSPKYLSITDTLYRRLQPS